MKRIMFYNHYHNGDLFYSKPFVQDIMSQIKTEFGYGHFNSEWVLKDLNIPQGPFVHNQIPDQGYTINYPDIFLINTWIGTFFKFFNGGECTWRYNYRCYGEIYKQTNDCLHTSLELKPLIEYLPTIDYSYYDCSGLVTMKILSG